MDATGLELGPDPATPIGYVVERAAVLPAWLEVGARTTDPAAFVAALAAGELQVEALRCIAVAIPVRQAVWWAWVSAGHVLRAVPPSPAQRPALEPLHALVERWITAPDDRVRATLWKTAQAIGLEHPVTLAAAAAWFSGGDIAPPGSPMPVPAPAGTAHAFVAACCAVSAAVGGDPAAVDARFAQAIAQGLEVVARLGGWPASVALARREHEEQVARAKPPGAPR